jgi:cephalosporin hydroxylase
MRRFRKQPAAATHGVPIVNPSASEFEVDNWLVTDFIVERLLPIVGTRPFPLEELALMVSAVCRFQPTHIFEWGTHVGKSARVFYETSEFYGLDVEIHSIDLPDAVDHVEHPGATRGEYVRDTPVRLHQGDGLDTSLSILAQAGARTKPLFFVDGDHSYDSVRRELRGIVETVKYPIALLHDTFYQSSDSGYNTGPYRAIRDVLQERECAFRIIEAKTGLPGMTLVFHEKALETEQIA